MNVNAKNLGFIKELAIIVSENERTGLKTCAKFKFAIINRYWQAVACLRGKYRKKQRNYERQGKMQSYHRWSARLFGFLSLWSVAISLHAQTPEMILAKILPDDVDVREYWVSEKYDGVRGYWDGQQRQMRSRNGTIIALPRDFAAQLPDISLDGELWIGRGQFERVVSVVRDTQPDDRAWNQVKYMVFELPDPHNQYGDFTQRITQIERITQHLNAPNIQAVKQWRVRDRAELLRQLDTITQAGGEGLMLHLASAPYQTGRSDALYKLKLRQDAEATVIGYVAGTGKYAGKVGSLRVHTDDGREFNVGSGLTDVTRVHPPAIGSVITYQFNGLTQKGLPRFPRFLRVRVDVNLSF